MRFSYKTCEKYETYLWISADKSSCFLHLLVETFFSIFSKSINSFLSIFKNEVLPFSHDKSHNNFGNIGLVRFLPGSQSAILPWKRPHCYVTTKENLG